MSKYDYSQHIEHDGRTQHRPGLLTLRYFAAWAILLIGGAFHPVLVLGLYPALGVWLSRAISKQAKFWSMANNIHDISKVKLQFIIAWPLAMLGFIGKSFVVKYL